MSRISSYLVVGALTSIAVLSLSAFSAHAQKIKLEKLDDLPRHQYVIEGTILEFMDSKRVFALAAELRSDLEADLEKYEIEDKTTLKDYYAMLGSIALLEGRDEEYLKLLDLRIALEEKEALRLTTGLFGRALVFTRSMAQEPNLEDVFRREYQSLVNKLPYELVESVVEETKGQVEILSEVLILGSREARFQPIIDKSDGVIGKEEALSLVRAYQTIRDYLPLKDIVVEVLTEYINANKVEKENIWPARELTLEDDGTLHPVTVAVWDSGLDTAIFRKLGQIWTNQHETINGKDDDKNGFVDDVHGIGYDLDWNKTRASLFPIENLEKERARLQDLMKGFSDVKSNINSPEASQLKRMMSGMAREDVQPFIEDLTKYGGFSHGTHVGGIVAEGNPAARLLYVRITFDYHMIPMEPTRELYEKSAQASRDTIAYFKKQGVRVVNMSWSESLASIESALKANNAGGTPEERKAFARELFEISKKALSEAIQGAPGILFVTSAGNSDNDVVFEEFIPSSFEFPNIMSVGAVDQAGEETTFTSFGNVDVYANGYEVMSYVPGGDRLALSGTSMSCPTVVNLAAKLFAMAPRLTPRQIRRVIEDSSERTYAGERLVRLIDPQAAVTLLIERYKRF